MGSTRHPIARQKSRTEQGAEARRSSFSSDRPLLLNPRSARPAYRFGVRPSRHVVIAARGSCATIIVAALTAEISREAGDSGWSAIDFVSHFTVLSNVFAAGLWLVLLLPGPELRNRDALRGAAVVYMLTTAVVYNTLLSGLHARVPWATLVLHVVAPLVVVIDWLVAPLAARVSTRAAMWWMVFPAAYAIYTLVRGHVVGWYPYYFLDPRSPHTYLLVGAYCLAIGAGIVARRRSVLHTAPRDPDYVRGNATDPER